MADFEPPRIRSIVAAHRVAQRLKHLSTNLNSELRKNQDKGDFTLTFRENPTTPLQRESSHALETTKPTRQATVSSGRASFPGVTDLSRFPETQNTYRTEPIRKFEDWKVREIIKTNLEEYLIGRSYDHELCNEMSRTLADAIKEQVKYLPFTRYKIICIVTIGQKRGQSVRIASQCVWDERFDNFAHYSFEIADIHATGMVYGIFCE